MALGIPAQAVLGGITVLTELNPWVVALHFLLSMALIAVCVLLLEELRGPALAEPLLVPRRALVVGRRRPAAPAALRAGAEEYPLDLLLEERCVSVNTAAAGGNASLMAIG